MPLRAARRSARTMPTRSTRLPPAAVPATEHAGAAPDQIRQFRHLTKNTLQCMMTILSGAPELNGCEAAQALRERLQGRILASARLSDALFGLTREPGTLRERLLALSENLVVLLAGDRAAVDVAVTVQGMPARGHDTLLVRLAHELVGNAVRHGFHERASGTIALDVREAAGGIVLAVTDDGWGFPPGGLQAGEGLSIVDVLLLGVGGRRTLERAGSRTVATVELPTSGARMAALPADQEHRRKGDR